MGTRSKNQIKGGKRREDRSTVAVAMSHGREQSDWWIRRSSRRMSTSIPKGDRSKDYDTKLRRVGNRQYREQSYPDPSRAKTGELVMPSGRRYDDGGGQRKCWLAINHGASKRRKKIARRRERKQKAEAVVRLKQQRKRGQF